MTYSSKGFVILALACLKMFLFVTTVQSIDAPPSNKHEDWFGVDVQVPAKPDDPTDNTTQSVRIKAFAGNNLTALALQFFDGHIQKYQPADIEFVVDSLENAGGGKCDSCKTLVEVLSERFMEMGEKFAKVTGYDEFGKPQRSMHVTEETESYIASVCKIEKYNTYARHIQKGCIDLLSANNSRKIFDFFNNGTLGPETIVRRKKQLCGEHLAVCDVKPLPSTAELGKCRACAEVVEDLSFHLRRSNRNPEFSGDKLRKKMSKEKDGYLSRRHIRREVEDLCTNVERIHDPKVKDELVEMCESLFEDHLDDLLETFVAKPGGHQLAQPGGVICVSKAEHCDSNEYARIWPLLESYHYNFTHYRNLPEPKVIGETPPPEIPDSDDDTMPVGDPDIKLEL